MFSPEALKPEDQTIPPCVLPARVLLPIQRDDRYIASAITEGDESHPHIQWANAGDGDMYVTCQGNNLGCEGGRAKVDRHDLVDYKMRQTTIAMGALCTSRYMFFSNNQIVRPFEVVE